MTDRVKTYLEELTSETDLTTTDIAVLQEPLGVHRFNFPVELNNQP